MIRRLALTTSLVLTVAVTSALTGCGALTSEDGSGTDDGQVDVAAAFYPLAFVTERVGGDHVDVVNLTAPGKEPHDLELSVRQAAQVTDADLVVYESGLQAAVESAVQENAEGETLDAAEVVGLEPFGHDGHDHTEEHTEGSTGDEENHDHGDLDPHFWQDPLKMVALAQAVEERLADLDPDHAADFEANLGSLVTDLQEVDAAYETGLQGCARDTIVVSHDAFGYLGRYGLDMEPIAGLSPDAEPSPADLARLETLIGDDGITTVFSERLASPKLSQTLADDLGIRTAVLDPIEGLTDETSDEDYLSLMRANLAAIRAANAC